MSKNKCNESEDQVISNTLKTLQEKYDISRSDVLKHIRDNKEKVENVPVSIFESGLSPLQAMVKYLFENKSYRFAEISKLLGRNQRTIGNTYRNANKKSSQKLNVEDSSYLVDLSIFSDRKLSVLEHVCTHLSQKYSLSYHKIAVLLGKDDRTIWTVCKRAEKKR